MTDVFMSYSRKDSTFTLKVVEAIKSTGIDVWIDQEDIPLSAEWWQEICRGIEGSNNFVAVISPNYVRSEICRREVEYALQANKRFVPILYSDIQDNNDIDALHPSLRAINWVFLRESDVFETAIQKLVATLKADLDYIRLHTRLLVQAEEWSRKNRSRSYALYGEELREAKAWLAESALKQPNPTEIHKEYIVASHKAMIKWRVLITASALFAVFLVSIFMLLAAHESNSRAIEETVSESLRLAGLAVNVIQREDGDPELGALLSIRALKTAYTPQADRTLVQSVEHLYTRRLFLGSAFDSAHVAYSPDGRFIIAGGCNRFEGGFCVSGNAKLWEVETGHELREFTGHTSFILNLVFSPDSRLVITGDGDGIARLWDINTGQQLHEFSIVDGPHSPISVAFSPDGQSIVTAGCQTSDVDCTSGIAILWDVNTGEQVRQFTGHTHNITAVDFHPDGRYILTSSYDDTARLWNLQTGEEVQQFVGKAYALKSTAISPNGHFVVTAGCDVEIGCSRGIVELWDLQNGALINEFVGHTWQVESVTFSPDGRYVLTGSSDRTARLWDVQTGQELRQFASRSYIEDASFSVDGRYVFTLEGNAIQVWDVATGEELRRLVPIRGSSMVVSPDGRYILTDGGVNVDQTGYGARLWALDSDDVDRQLIRTTNEVNSVAFGPATQILIGSSILQVWDSANAEFVRQFGQYPGCLSSVALSLDGRYLLTGCQRSYTNENDFGARLWDVRTGEEVQRFGASLTVIESVAFSPDGHYVFTGGLNNIARLWDIRTGEEIQRFGQEGFLEGTVASAAFSPDGAYILTGHKSVYYDANDFGARLWNVYTGDEVQHFGEATPYVVNSVAFSPDGRHVLTGSSDRTARLWDVRTGQEVQQFEGHIDIVTSVAFSPDGRHVLTGSSDHTARLWDIQTGEEVRQFAGHLNSVTSIAFSSDGHFVLTGSSDNTVRLWDADYRDFIIYACTRIFRDFTDEERQAYAISDNEATCTNLGNW